MMQRFNAQAIRAGLVVGSALSWMSRRQIKSERGEGVISAAIAVLIMAFLGVALWVAFKATLDTATNTVNGQVAQIGTATQSGG